MNKLKYGTLYNVPIQVQFSKIKFELRNQVYFFVTAVMQNVIFYQLKTFQDLKMQ